MPEHPEDSELLRRYAAARDEAAFAELVRRHLDLVHSAALRQLNGDTHLAQDATQLVFVDLARKAPALVHHRVLAGWLFTSTRFAAAKLVRAEQRRLARETKAHTMLSADAAPDHPAAAASTDWTQVRPVLDAALADLSSPDRDAILLRFFEGRDFADIGTRLRLNANTARMRVDRALEKLQLRLRHRGVTSTPAALALALGAQAVTAAPAGLATVVTGVALASSTATLGASAFGFFAFMKTSQLILGLASIAAVASFGAALVAARCAHETEVAVVRATTDETAAQANFAALESQVRSARDRLQQADRENARLLMLARDFKIDLRVEDKVVTSAEVNTRVKRALALVKDGASAEALQEMIWCYDVGTPRVQMGAISRQLELVKGWAELAQNYPPAREALEERREKARRLMTPDRTGEEAAADFGAINRAVAEPAVTVAAMDQFPAGDARRKALARTATDYLVEIRRYADAATSMDSGTMSAVLARASVGSSVLPPAEAKSYIEYTLVQQAQYLEVLVGTGQLEPARQLVTRLLQLENSESTRDLLRQRVSRTGQSPEAVGLSSR